MPSRFFFARYHIFFLQILYNLKYEISPLIYLCDILDLLMYFFPCSSWDVLPPLHGFLTRHRFLLANRIGFYNGVILPQEFPTTNEALKRLFVFTITPLNIDSPWLLILNILGLNQT